MLAAVAMLLLASSAPALAGLAENVPTPPAYVLEEDGTVIKDGDVATDCRSFALYLKDDNYNHLGDLKQARNVLQQCKERGFLRPEGTQLPDTAGPAIFLPAAGLLLAIGLIGLKVSRRHS